MTVEWISCEDKLPNVKDLYIVCKKICGHAIVFGAVWDENKWVSVENRNKELDYITDWMRFPDPPQTANNSK